VTSQGINILAYVYIPGGKMLNALLIQKGYAEYEAKLSNLKYEENFLRLEDEAKAESRGFWGKNN